MRTQPQQELEKGRGESLPGEEGFNLKKKNELCHSEQEGEKYSRQRK